jgi:aspartyl-tRNA(Asn)/glutamyl-tRNA(Gln) amidotransferase subunit A
LRSNARLRVAAAGGGRGHAGAILVGKSATHEFGWGITTANETFGPTLNPWDLERSPGGSSGGSGAALAAGLVPLALGTDTGGSIRMPSAFCGTAGLKPTFGAVPTDGVRPLARSLDHVGPMARTPGDLARLFEILSGVRALERVRRAEADPRSALEGVRIGVLPERPAVPLAPDVRAVLDEAGALLEELGARLVEFRGPDLDEAYDTYSTILMSEALAEHRRAGIYPARSEEYGSDVRARMRLAEDVSEADVATATKRRAEIAAEFESGLEDVDVVLGPVSPGPPARHANGDDVVHLGERMPFRRLVIPYVVVQDLGGFPACVVRGGFDAQGLPVGLQLTTARGADPLALATAAAWFAATPGLQQKWPALAPGRA